MRIRKDASLIIITLSCLLNCSSSTRHQFMFVNLDHPLITQRGKYTYFNTKPLDGTTIEYYPSGGIKRQSKFRDGLLNGNVTTWYPEGNKQSVRFYNNGEKEGTHTGWWPNGNVRFEYQFSRGMYHGTFREWYENGKPLHLFNYREGNEVSAVGWRDNGKTYINFVVRNGKKYGLTNTRLCYSLKDENGIYQSSKK